MTLVLGVVSAVVVVLPPLGSAVRTPCAVGLVVWLPGRAIVAALPGIRDPADRVIFSMGLSLASTALAALLLDLTSPGLRAETWGPALGLLTAVASLIAIVRRRHLPSPRLGKPQFRLIASGLAAAVLLAGAGVVTAAGIHAQSKARFTALWLVPDRADRTLVDVGVHNAEGQPLTYTLDLRTILGPVGQRSRVEVAAGGTWVTRLRARFRPLTAELTRPGFPAPYRTVTLRGPGP